MKSFFTKILFKKRLYPVEDMDATMIEYEIEVKTGLLHGAGTDHQIKIEISGSKGATRLRTLDQIFVDEFETNQTDTFTKKDVDVGNIEFIGLLVTPKLLEDPWYIETIKIRRKIKDELNKDEDGNGLDEECKAWETFPIYSWIMPKKELQYFFSNQTLIPQNETGRRSFKMSEFRSRQTMKDSVEWTPSEVKLKQFPGYINIRSQQKLDLNIKFTDNRDRDFNSNRRKVLQNATFGGVRNLYKEFTKFKHYELAAKRLRGLESSPWLENELWRTDEEFGRQMLNGINPAMIQKCKTMPDNFPINNSIVRDFLTRGLTLEEEMKEGNIYVINHNVLQGVSTGYFPIGSGPKKGVKLELAVPLCLLYNGRDDKLRPIAIQLGQEPGKKFPIWTPNDKEEDWLLAKIWYRNADYQVHQMRSHLAFTHLLVEPIAVATFRCLPPCHPVYKVLRNHLQFVIAINTIGRARLISKVF